MREYQSNSHRSKQEQANASDERRVKKVVKGKVTTKKNDGRKLANIFISEDASSVKSYVLMDVFVPAIKKMISDIVRDGIDIILYGETKGRSGGSGRSAGSNVSYRSYYDNRNGRDSDRYSSRTRFEYDDIVFESRGEAETVVDEMIGVIEQYGFVRVDDMYDLAGLTAPYTSNKYGWTSLRSAEVTRVRDGYVIKLPKAMPID